MDDPFLMGVLNRLADRQEQLQSFLRCQMLLVAVLRDRQPFDQFHHEIRSAGVGRAGIEHFGNVRMIHHRQRLPLGFETGDHLPRVHSRLDDLQRHAPMTGSVCSAM